MTSPEFLAMVTDVNFLGDPCVKTQHLLGFAKWVKVSEDEVVGHIQIRAAHQVYTSVDLSQVKLKGHSHATNEFYFSKVDGVWKFAGLKPKVHWNEHAFENVFKGSYGETTVASG
jgi:scytalone dehydratase